jgi:hypothetical protein
VIRLDKAAEEIIDWLECAGGSMFITKLAEIVGARANNLRSRVIQKLVVAGVVTVDEDTASLVEDWLEKLDEEREMTGEFEAHDRDEARYKREREEYRRYLLEERGVRYDEPEDQQHKLATAVVAGRPVQPDYRESDSQRGRISAKSMVGLAVPKRLRAGRDGP